MPAAKGRKLRIKIEDPANPGTFTAIAGMREEGFSISIAENDVTDKDDEAWRKLMAGGIKSVSLSGSGITKTDDLLKLSLSDETIVNMEIVRETGAKLAGAFEIRSYEGTGPYEGAETFSASFESSGPVEFTPAP